MKRILCVLLLCGLLMSLLCVTAFAAEEPVAPTESGIYNLDEQEGCTVKLTTTATEAKIGEETVQFYAGAEKLEVSYSGVESGQCLVVALDDNSGVPKEGNIVYIDQTLVSGNTVTFTVYPSQLENGKTYHIYLSGGGLGSLTEVASFQYYIPYKLGDVNEDGIINTADALAVIRHFVGTPGYELTGNQLLAANVNGDVDDKGKALINTVDAMWILRVFTGTANAFPVSPK